MSLFDDAKLGIPCPKCGHETEQTIRRLKADREITCAGCGAHIEVRPDKLTEGIRRVEKQLGDLKRKLSRLGKRR